MTYSVHCLIRLSVDVLVVVENEGGCLILNVLAIAVMISTLFRMLLCAVDDADWLLIDDDVLSDVEPLTEFNEMSDDNNELPDDWATPLDADDETSGKSKLLDDCDVELSTNNDK